ncbi:MAG TPA: CRISPR-associated endonuclease Cas2 [Verrucomicrobiae bacterium]
MARTADYVAVYDVSNDAERTRVAKVLEGFGIRVQMSAFEC